MKTNTKFDWDEMVEAMVESAMEGHKWFGKGTLDGKDSPEEALADSLEAFNEACYDRLQEHLCNLATFLPQAAAIFNPINKQEQTAKETESN